VTLSPRNGTPAVLEERRPVDAADRESARAAVSG
jgi:hypothetical protein